MDKYSTKPSGLTIFIRIMDLLVWAIIFAAFLFFDQARPETRTILDIRYAKDIRETWDYGSASISMWLFVTAAIISITGLFINLPFLGRKKVHISYGLIIALFISLGGSIAYMFILL